jgi:hypothetical protein
VLTSTAGLAISRSVPKAQNVDLYGFTSSSSAAATQQTLINSSTDYGLVNQLIKT